MSLRYVTNTLSSVMYTLINYIIKVCNKHPQLYNVYINHVIKVCNKHPQLCNVK